MKTVRPTHLLDGTEIHYLWELSAGKQAECDDHKDILFTAARSITALGWGIDMAIGNGQLLTSEQADCLHGQRWRPVDGRSAIRLRVPRQGTLAALAARYDAFLQRLPASGGFVPVPPLTAFATVGYRCDTDLSSRPFAAFELLTPDAERFRAFDPVRRTLNVAGMVRAAAADAASRHRPDDLDWVKTFVLGIGDGPDHQATTDARLSYIPIPTIEERKHDRGMTPVVGSIRRVLVVEPADGAGMDVAWVRQRLSGQSLHAEGTRDVAAILSLLPTGGRRTPRVLQWYVPPNGSRMWSSVTPVILPGYDDRNQTKTEQLLRRTLDHAGFPHRLQSAAVFEWRREGFRPGVDLARRYRVAAHHEPLPRYHVRITWPVPVQGPICLGRGRHYGMGLLATDEAP
jgi:CRISPR-associated protein Csb2